ncbi:MAG: SPOR domain-containing protein [Bacteroidales bacterium]|nr:SPOR domain-containing protein [Bacteroidales bacterium]
MPRYIIIVIFILIFAGKWSHGQVPDICLTRDEYRLYSLVNEFRAKQGLPVIPISKSLSYVAKIHTRDLYLNNPDTSFCSLNSWSNKGPWTDCCHSKYTPNPNCILNKPKELTQYQGEGHELVYWDSEALHPDTVFRFWSSISQAREVLLNEKKWSFFSWKAMGVGMFKGYACVWLGEALDDEAEPTICAAAEGADDFPLPAKDTEKDIVTSPTGRYYVIFGSYTNLPDARKLLEKYREDGFYQAKVIVKENTFRISLSDHGTQQEAQSAKKRMGKEFEEAWITKF